MDVVRRMRDSGVPFTCIFTTSRRSWRPWRRESIRQMAGLGLPIVLASDDPALFPTTLSDEYAIAVDALGADAQLIVELALRSLAAAWLDDDTKRPMRKHFDAENREVLRELGIAEPIGQQPRRPVPHHFAQEGTP
jgi:adenosine deaminase